MGDHRLGDHGFGDHGLIAVVRLFYHRSTARGGGRFGLMTKVEDLLEFRTETLLLGGLGSGGLCSQLLLPKVLGNVHA